MAIMLIAAYARSPLRPSRRPAYCHLKLSTRSWCICSRSFSVSDNNVDIYCAVTQSIIILIQSRLSFFRRDLCYSTSFLLKNYRHQLYSNTPRMTTLLTMPKVLVLKFRSLHIPLQFINIAMTNQRLPLLQFLNPNILIIGFNLFVS